MILSKKRLIDGRISIDHFFADQFRVLHKLEQWVDACVAYYPRRRPRKEVIQKACLVAHRGAHDAALSIQENTLAAFDRALQLSCYGIELDVHATADEVLVVNHDPTLKRLWGHDLAINSLSFDALRALVPDVPSLAEVVERYGKQMHLFIELKTPFHATAALVKTLASLTPGVDYHLISLDDKLLPTLDMFPKSTLILVPIHNNTRHFCNLSLQQGYGGVLGHYLLLSNRQAKRLQSANQLVGVGFVDSKFSLYRELNRGIYLLFSDNVAVVGGRGEIGEIRNGSKLSP